MIFFAALLTSACSTEIVSPGVSIKGYVLEHKVCDRPIGQHYQPSLVSDYLIPKYTRLVSQARLQPVVSPHVSDSSSGRRVAIEQESPFRIVHEEGDHLPSLVFSDDHGRSKTLPLSPVIRREGLENISRIAVSSDMRSIAIIAKRRTANSRVVLRIERFSREYQLYDLNAYDIAWFDNDNLLISTFDGATPRRLYYTNSLHKPLLIYADAEGSHEILFQSSSSPQGLFISIQSPTSTSIFTFDPPSPTRLRSVLADDIPGAQCVLWKGQETCLSFTRNVSGSVITGSDFQQSPIASGTLALPIVSIDGDENDLRVFLSNGTATILRIFSHTDSQPITIGPLGPVTTLVPARTPGPRPRGHVTIRSFLTPSYTLPVQQLIKSSIYQRPPKSVPLAESYEESLTAHSYDGTAIPISLVSPRNPRGLMVQAYGAYGRPSFAEHSSLYSSLVSQGVAVAIAHVRGGGELGPRWHRGGRLEGKKLAVSDLQAAIEYLQDYLKVSPKQTVLRGRSAGGWLVARTAVRKPLLLSGIILDAPLLDLRSATSAPDAPLYHRDVAEWGNISRASELSAAPLVHRISLPIDILVIAPLRDELIPLRDTLEWSLQATCRQPPGNETWILPLPGVGHDGPANKSEARLIEAAEKDFIRRVLQRVEDDRGL